MNFKLPKIPNIPLPNVPLPDIDKVSSSLLNEVSKSVPDIITNAAINSIPDINEIVDTLFKKFLSEYNLSENMGIAVIGVLICTIIIVPNLIVTFYSEYLNINTFYTYLIISVICGVSLLSLKLDEEKRNTVLYTNGILGSLVTIYALYLGANYYYVC
jgi:hypothetical protein